MQKSLTIQNQKITYTLRKNILARHITLKISGDGKVVVTIPCKVSESYAEKCLKEKADWLLSKIAHFKSLQKETPKLRLTRKEYLKNKKEARRIITEKLLFFNKFYNLPYKKIAIRNQRSRWGSCSKKGNLNFNFKIIFLPEHAQNYIIVHELCHLQEFNHSKNFWHLVSQTIPNYKQIRKEIKSISFQ